MLINKANKASCENEQENEQKEYKRRLIVLADIYDYTGGKLRTKIKALLREGVVSASDHDWLTQNGYVSKGKLTDKGRALLAEIVKTGKINEYRE